MALQAGTRLGPYEILEPLGAGGMGEVYLAHDARLGRKVALKILPAELASQPARLGRFEQEAIAAAALNHPHIAAVFDIGSAAALETGGDEAAVPTHFMVQEYLKGETLGEKLARAPLPLAKALDLAIEVTEALAAAHAAGIVHRDLKPENVFVTAEGHAKVLDFGLAKLTEAARAPLRPSAEASEAPTRLQTVAGEIMGTPAYMAPEQIEGQARVDHRADVFAFGCLFYEMLTGSQLFAGKDPVESLHRVLHEPVTRLPEREERFPAQLQWVLDKCLAKDPDERYQHTRDLAVRLKHLRRQVDSGLVTRSARPDAASPARRSPRRLAWIAVAAVSLALGFVAGSFFGSGSGPRPTEPVGLTRFSISLPEGGQLALGGQPPVVVAVSRDGSQVAYAVNRDGRTVLYRRMMDELEARPIPGTEDGHGPFFSPRGDWLGFYANGKLKSVSLTGGAPAVIADASTFRGATTTADGQVVYAPSINSGLWMAPTTGGPAREITQVDGEAGEYSHRWPHAMPDGKTILFTIDRGGSFDEADIGALSLESGERRLLVEGGSHPVYAPSGHLLFGRQGTLLAAPFDPRRLQVLGPPTVVVEGIATQQDTGAAHFALSHSGALVYLPGGADTNERMLVLVDENGTVSPLPGLPLRAYQQPSLSPDGSRLAVNVVEATHDLWISEMARATLTRLTFHGDNHSPTWSPDGKRIAFSSERGGPSQIYWIDADGSGGEQELLSGEHSKVPTSFGPAGSVLAYTEVHPETRGDIWTLAVEARRAEPFLVTEYDEKEATFSPDGSFLAYVSNESGRYEVYVQPFPGPGRKLQISSDGGGQPAWSRDGRRVYYRSGDRMMEVRIAAPTLAAEPPRELFRQRIEAGYVYNPRIYDVAADGSGFVMAKGESRAVQDRLDVVLDWSGELGRLVPGVP